MSGLADLRRSPPVLEGTKVFLRLFAREHLTGAYVSWLNDSQVCRYNSHGETPYTADKAEAYLRSVSNSDVTVVFAVHDRAGRAHIGNLSINDISWRHRSAEISVLIGEKSYWNGGYGTEAVRLAAEIGFKTLKLHRLWLEMTTDNAGMIGIARKLGFREEGVFREAFFKQGRFKDLTRWSLLNPDESAGGGRP